MNNDLYDRLMEMVIVENNIEDYKERRNNTIDILKTNQKLEDKIPSKFTISFNNRNFIVYNTDLININRFYSKILKDIKNILNNEKKIINQVYNLYKDNYNGNFNKDKSNDKIESFNLIKPRVYNDDYNIEIQLSNINQFYTMFHNGKIIEDETGIY